MIMLIMWFDNSLDFCVVASAMDYVEEIMQGQYEPQELSIYASPVFFSMHGY